MGVRIRPHVHVRLPPLLSKVRGLGDELSIRPLRDSVSHLGHLADGLGHQLGDMNAVRPDPLCAFALLAFALLALAFCLLSLRPLPQFGRVCERGSARERA